MAEDEKDRLTDRLARELWAADGGGWDPPAEAVNPEYWRETMWRANSEQLRDRYRVMAARVLELLELGIGSNMPALIAAYRDYNTQWGLLAAGLGLTEERWGAK